MLYSCSLFRSTTKETTLKNDIKKETEVSKNTGVVEVKHQSINSEIGTKEVSDNLFDQMEDMQADWSTNTIIYDTNKPIDSLTGKHPVLSEQITTAKIHHDKNTNTREQLSKDTNNKTNLQADSKSEQTTKSDSTSKLTDKSKSDESNKESTNWKLWFGLGIGSVISVWLAIKFGMRLILPRLP